MRAPEATANTITTPPTAQPAPLIASSGGANGSSSVVKSAPRNHRAPPKRLALGRSTPGYGSWRLAKTVRRCSRTPYQLRKVAQTVNAQPLADVARTAQSRDVGLVSRVA